MVYDWLSSIAFFWPNEALIKKIKVTEAKTELDRLTTPSNESQSPTALQIPSQYAFEKNFVSLHGENEEDPE